jgi:hypothetical protein
MAFPTIHGAKPNDRLVAEKADDRGRHNGAERAHRLGIDEASDRFIAREERGTDDDEPNYHARKVF